jgi:two-component system sensor histidine kinase DesK
MKDLETDRASLASLSPGKASVIGLAGAQAQPEVIAASSGISLRLWRLYAYFWLVCLIFPALFLIQTRLAPARLMITLAGLATLAAAYLWVMWSHPLKGEARSSIGLRSSAILVAGLSGLALVLSLAYGSPFLWLFLGVSAIAGVTLPPRAAFWAVLVMTLLTLGLGVWISGGPASVDWLHLIPLVLLIRGLGLDMAGLVRLADALRELYGARQELARQAVVEERLRLSRDLHDLLGHTLSMITLKSELAGRLVGKDPARAAQEIQEVERVARQALREVREAVAGYRGQTLSGELEGARQILEAAGIAAEIEYEGEPYPPGMEAALAWMVREGVTNVIRHSHARRCFIRITSVGEITRAEVINDGYREPEGGVNEKGSGLPGLAERVAAVGGRLEAGPIPAEDGFDFRLQVELPISGGRILKQDIQDE